MRVAFALLTLWYGWNVEVGADVVDRVDGKSIGKIRAVGNSWVLALLRIAPALKATAGRCILRKQLISRFWYIFRSYGPVQLHNLPHVFDCAL